MGYDGLEIGLLSTLCGGHLKGQSELYHILMVLNFDYNCAQRKAKCTKDI